MGKLRYWSVIPNDKPEWLLRLQLEISRVYGLRGMKDTPEEWLQLQDFVDGFIRSLYERRDIRVRSEITSRLATDAGRTALVIERNGKDVQIYRIIHN